MNNATLAPRRSSSAFVPRVVANRSSIAGNGPPWLVPVTNRAASTGASSGDRTSNRSPAATSIAPPSVNHSPSHPATGAPSPASPRR